MVPSSSRQLFVWSLPTLAFLLSLLWYHRRRGTLSRSDPGGTMQDTGSTFGDQIQQTKDLQMSSTGSVPAEKQLPNREGLCETVTIVQGDIKLQTDKHMTPFPTLNEEQKPETSHQHTSELVLMEKVMSETAGNAYPGIPYEADNHRNSTTNEILTKANVQEVSAAKCPVGKLAQELCVEKNTVKSIVGKEAEISVLEGSVCNGAGNPKHSTDKISEAISSPVQVEGKEMDETMNINMSSDVNTNISSLESSKSSHLLPEVNVLCTSDSLERTAYKQSAIGGGSEDLPLNEVTIEEMSRMLQVSSNRIQQDKDTTVKSSKDDIDELSLNLEIPENLKFVDCVEEKDTDTVQSTSAMTSADKEEAGDDESVSRIQQDNKDSSVGLQSSKDEVEEIPLNLKIPENLKFVDCVEERDASTVQLTSAITTSAADEEEAGDDESVSSVDSFSVATTVVIRELSTHNLTIEKIEHDDDDDDDDESAKMSTAETSAQGSVSVPLECKLSSLELNRNATGEARSDAGSISTNGTMAGSISVASEQQKTERDSANHSPADVMLASPSISSYSDAQSEGSSDSGKGCSDVATPPSRTPACESSLSGDVPLPSVYEFVLPQHLVGRLIGRHGFFVLEIKKNTNANILIKRHPDTQRLKICAVEGSPADIESALEMIRKKFPLSHYPNVTLEQVCFLPAVRTFPLIPESLQLQLIEGVNNDVILSSLMSPAHFFLQQPTHPTFPALVQLNACMNFCYSEPTAPPLPTPVQVNAICVALTMDGWYRAQVVAVDTETDTCDIKFVDYGGYSTVNSSALRQIRGDFMTLPFQAAECYLANVSPIGGHEAAWTKDSMAGMEELTCGQVLQAQVCGYAEDGLPVVYLYAIRGSQMVLVNQELVLRGLAEWIEPAET